MRTLFSLLLLLIGSFLQAQSLQISGTVVDRKNKPIEGVNVYIEESFDGALSDKQGYFVFAVQDSLVEGTLKLKRVNYSSIVLPIRVTQDSNYSFVMEEGEDYLEEIVIKTTSNAKRGNSERLELNAMDVVSTAGSPGNIIGALSTLPGAQVNGEDGRLLIRGGRAEESGIYVNGIKVFQPYTATIENMPVRSKFNPFLFKGMSFSAGGYSAEFGGALSGILEMDTTEQIDPSRKDISISSVGGSFGQTHQWKKNSLSYNVNYLNLGAYTVLVEQRYKTKKPFSTQSGEIVYKRELKDAGYKLYAAIDHSSIAYEQERYPSHRIDTLSMNNNNLYMNSAYFKKITPFMRVDIGTGIGYSTYSGEINEKYINTKNWDLNQKLKLSYQWSGRWQSFLGIDFQIGQLKVKKAIEQLQQQDEKTANQLAFFFENQWRITTDLTWKAGVRINKSSAISQGVIEPRTTLLYQINSKQQLVGSYGVFHQALSSEYLIDVKPQEWMKAQHYILNYTYNFNKRLLRIEAFYKDYTQLLLVDSSSTNPYNQEGKGYVKGFDLFWKDQNTIENFSYWITYTYMDSKRKEMYSKENMQPSYVTKHNLSIVTKYWINTWKSQISMTYNYSTPRLFHTPNTTEYTTYKSSPIHNLSMSWAYLVRPQKILYLSIDNLLGRNPVYAYQFNTTKQQPDLVQASAKRFVYVGFMWTISANKKTNQLENL